ncbi:MAG: amidohydrolase [Myxococcales bacterium]|nr:amidohydrolase [Myxococcales bacterium]
MDIRSVPLISADSHVEEPNRLWFDELPKSAHGFLPPELMPRSESESAFAKRIGARDDAAPQTDDETRGNAWRQEVASRGTTSVDARYEVMRVDGVAGECIYPTKGLYIWNMDDAKTGKAACRIYNDWILDTLEKRSPRFRCAGLIPTWSVDAAIEEVERVAAMGLGSLMLPLVGTPEYNHQDWEPLWSVIEATGRPVVMHQGSGHSMLFYRGRGASVANLLATQSMAPRTAGLLATSGALADHPNLHFVFVETNAGWLSWAMNTLDHYTEAFKQNVGWVRPVLPEKPSFYMKRQLHGTFQVDPVAIANLAHTGVEPLLWGSDYPHTEGTYPHSRDTVVELCGHLSDEDAVNIVSGTAARLFGFAPEVLTTPV